MKFLVIQTAFIGDTILASAVIEKLSRYYPDGTIDFVLRKGNEGLFNQDPRLHNIYVWDKQNKKYTNLIKLVKNLRKTSYDYIINLHRHAASGFLTTFAKASKKHGFAKNPFSLFFTDKFPHEIGNGDHETERNQTLIAGITTPAPLRPKLYPSNENYKSIRDLNVPPYICIAPASVWYTKQFPESQWVELINTLTKYTIYLIGGPGDSQLADSIIQESDHANIKNICGYLNLMQTAALMEGAEMNFVNDSAPLHLASAINAPVTAIFCSTVPAFGFFPLSDTSRIVEVKENLYCRPCGIHGFNSCPEGHFKCAYDIDINDALFDTDK